MNFLSIGYKTVFLFFFACAVSGAVWSQGSDSLPESTYSCTADRLAELTEAVERATQTLKEAQDELTEANRAAMEMQAAARASSRPPPPDLAVIERWKKAWEARDAAQAALLLATAARDKCKAYLVGTGEINTGSIIDILSGNRRVPVSCEYLAYTVSGAEAALGKLREEGAAIALKMLAAQSQLTALDAPGSPCATGATSPAVCAAQRSLLQWEIHTLISENEQVFNKIAAANAFLVQAKANWQKCLDSEKTP